MERLQKAAILTELADQLRSRGSWCGHTHLQKATYFLQDLLGVPTGYEFMLYKQSPYTFDLSDELTALRADYLIEFDHKSPGYGPGLVPTQTSRELRARYPVTLARHAREIEFISRVVGSKGVSEPERLATALYLTRELGGTTDLFTRVARMRELKPHVSPEDAVDSIQEFDRIATEAKALVLDSTHA